MSPRADKNDSKRPESSRPARRFVTTRWSMVAAAGAKRSDDANQALATLCEAYWYPLYAFVRRRGYSVDDARDLTQAFFAELLEKDRLRAADRQRGRFRSFLLSALEHFLANEWRKAGAIKRGGRRARVSLDLERGEQRYSLEPTHGITPEKLYERRWALALLDRTLVRLRAEYLKRGKLDLFDRLKATLGGDRHAVAYAQLAVELKMTEAAVKVAVHRLRRRYREILRAEIADTVASPEEVDDELRDLFRALAE